jgi:hypothetical protein
MQPRIKDNYQGTEYYRIEWGNQCDSCRVQNSVRVPRVDEGLWSWDYTTIRYKDAENKCARRGSLKRCIRETALRESTAS